MSSWSKTLHGKNLTAERAFLPFQHAMIRLGYELTDVREGKRLKFKRRTESTMAWDNHKRAHNVDLDFKQRTRGIFTKEQYLEIDITFNDWDMTVSEGAAQAWQEIADKLQVMLSDAAIFLPVAPPSAIMPPSSYAMERERDVQPRVAESGPSGLLPGALVSFRWIDGDVYRGRVVGLAANSAVIMLESGRTTDVELSSLTLLELPASVETRPVALERERLVERQIVVMRCRYCKKLTPVDLTECRECGARL